MCLRSTSWRPRRGIRLRPEGIGELSKAGPASAAARLLGVSKRFGPVTALDRVDFAVAPGESLLDLAKTIARMPPLRLEGVMFYPGHVNLAAPGGEQALAELATDLSTVLDAFEADGLPTGVVSGGSTPTLFHSHSIPGLTEIRPGTYVFNDCSQVAMGACRWNDCAASVLTTVVSTPRPDSVVIDGGSKAFTSDPLRGSDEATFGRVLEMPGSRFHKMNEEHGMIDTGQYDGPPVRIGQRLRIVPNHVCVTVNMHERAHGIRGKAVEQSWVVEGRGKLQ